MNDKAPGQRHDQQSHPGHQRHGHQQSHPQHTAAQYSHPQHPDPAQPVPPPPGAHQHLTGAPYRAPYPAPPKRSTPVWPWVLIGVMMLLCGGCFGIAGMASDSAVDGPVRTVGDNQFLQTTAQGEYILVHVSVTNIGDRPQTYFGSNQKLFDDQGKQFENDTRAEINLHDHMATTINPGNTIDVVLAFDVPVGTVADKLQLHDSMFSGGAKVVLR